ncbi:MAG TPA: hypothetical protein PKZ76_04390 [Xanthomonadaceae bacterium]|nr:hypothetical protein [Xanthomonadaceae bacterium]
MRHQIRSILFISLLMAGSATLSHAQQITVTVGAEPACNFQSISAALDAIGPEVELEILVQGQPAEDSTTVGNQQGPLRIAAGRKVTLIGDSGQGLSSCTGEQSSRRPVITRDNGAAPGRLITVEESAELFVRNIDIVDGNAGGVLVRDLGIFRADGVRFEGHRTAAGVSGAAISIDDARVSLRNTQFFDNASPAAGGAIFCNSDSAVRTARIEMDRDVVFGEQGFGRGNRAGFDGGAIALFRHCMLIAASGSVLGLHFENNQAGRDGGAIAAADRVSEPGMRNFVHLDRFLGAVFLDNFASRDGGAIHVGSQVELLVGVKPGSGTIFENGVTRFINNAAGRDGGALVVLGQVLDGNNERGRAEITASFHGNMAQRGGAIWADGGRQLALTPSACVSADILVRDRYCDVFEFNLAHGSPSRSAIGGALYLTGAARATVRGYAIDGNDAMTAGGLAGRGSAIGLSGSSRLRMQDTLLRRNGHDDPDPGDGQPEATTAIDLLGSGNEAQIALSTIVQQRGDVWLRVQAGSAARLIGVIADQNAAGIAVSASATLTGFCNNVQLDDVGAPTDPGFVPPPGTARGLFRLAPDSPMRAFCNRVELTNENDDVIVGRDLDGIERRGALVDGVEHVDIGAFGSIHDEAIFRSGFESGAASP